MSFHTGLLQYNHYLKTKSAANHNLPFFPKTMLSQIDSFLKLLTLMPTMQSTIHGQDKDKTLEKLKTFDLLNNNQDHNNPLKLFLDRFMNSNENNLFSFFNQVSNVSNPSYGKFMKPLALDRSTSLGKQKQPSFF